MLRKLSIILFCIITLLPTVAFAQGTDLQNPSSYTRTILPEVNKDIIKSNADCRYIITQFEDIYFFEAEAAPAPAGAVATGTDPEAEAEEPNAVNATNVAELGSLKRFTQALTIMQSKTDRYYGLEFEELSRNDILGCAIVTGRISIFYLGMFISYAMNMIAIASGTVAMLFIIIGGYQYVIGSLTQNTDGAKTTIKNAIIGLLVSTGAWILVNIVMALITS